jgi:integrase
MRGTVFAYKLKGGGKRWRGQVELPGKKRERLSQAGFAKKREAEDWVNQQVNRLRANQAVKNSDATLAEFIEWWLKHKIEPDRSPTTFAAYSGAVRHVTSRLGSTKLYDLTAVALEEAYLEARKESDLSAKTVHNIHGCIHAALAVAVRRKLIPFNPAAGCELPKVRKPAKGALEPDQVNEYMRAADGRWFGPVIRLAAATGARRGELLALRWADLDWMAGTIRIHRAIVVTGKGIAEKSTKEGNDDRKPIKLDPATIEVLRMHRQTQEQQAAMFGADYKRMDLIFARPDGGYVGPNYLSKVVLELGRKLKLPHVGLHILRHSHGSLLIANGTPIPVVSERLGHCDPYTTLKIYAHALPSDNDKAAGTWADLIGRRKK